MNFGLFALLTLLIARSYFAMQVIHVVAHLNAGSKVRNSLAQDKPLPDIHSESLTPNGYHQLFLVGAQLARNYPSLLTAEQNSRFPKNIQILASPSSYSQLSAKSLLAGILGDGTLDASKKSATITQAFPPFEGLQADQLPGYDTQLPEDMLATTITTPDPNHDFYFFDSSNLRSCPNIWRIYINLAQSIKEKHHTYYDYVIQQLIEEQVDRRQYFGTHEQSWSLNDILTLGQDIQNFEWHQGKAMDGLSRGLQRALVNFYYLLQTERVETSGMFFALSHQTAKRIILSLNQAITKGSAADALQVILGTDTVLLNYMVSFDLTSVDCMKRHFFVDDEQLPESCVRWPGFGGGFLYELAVEEGRYFVRTLFNNKLVHMCRSPTDDGFCELQEFMARFKDRSMYKDEDSFNEFCENPDYMKWKHKSLHEQIVKVGYLKVVLPGLLLLVLIGATVLRVLTLFINHDEEERKHLSEPEQELSIEALEL